MKKDGKLNRYPKQFYVMGVPPIDNSELGKMLDDAVRRQGYCPIQYGHESWVNVESILDYLAGTTKLMAKCTAVYLGKKQAKKITLVHLPEEQVVFHP